MRINKVIYRFGVILGVLIFALSIYFIELTPLLAMFGVIGAMLMSYCFMKSFEKS